jgi:hypothetical protein
VVAGPEATARAVVDDQRVAAAVRAAMAAAHHVVTEVARAVVAAVGRVAVEEISAGG